MPTGWLYIEKQDKRNEWLQRYFVLDEGYLRYFVDDADLDPVAAVNVRGIEATSVGKSRLGKYAFRLNVTKQADGRYKYVLAGEGLEDSRQWLTWLCEEGVAANANTIKLSAKALKNESSMARLFSFKPKGVDEKKGNDGRMMSFLSFGGKKAPKPSSASPKGSAVDLDDPASSQKELSPPREAAVSLVRVASSVAESLAAHERSLLIPQSSLELLANDGTIDGDAPFTEVFEGLSRRGLVEAVETTRRISVEAIEQHRLPPTSASTGSTLSSQPEPDEDSGDGLDDFDEVDDQPVGLAAGQSSGGSVIFTKTDDGLAAGQASTVEEAADEAPPPVVVPSFSSFSAGQPSLKPLSAAEVLVEYGGNVSPRQRNVSSVAEDAKEPPAEEPPAEEPPAEEPPAEEKPPARRPSLAEQIAGVGRALSTSIAAAFQPPVAAAAAVALDENASDEALGKQVAANAVATALRLTGEGAPPPKRPSLLARLAEGFKKEEPPEPPKETYVDSADDACVRQWVKQVLLMADDTKTVSGLGDATRPLREHLRSGVVLCAVLNALKPGATGRVRTPAATASRFAKLEPLNTYKRACGAAGLSDADCLDANEWLDGETMRPLLAHFEALSRLSPSAPKFVPPGGPQRSVAKGAGKAGVVPHHTAQDVMKAKGGAHSHTRSVASASSKAFKGAKTNASAARAVFEIEKAAGATDGAKGEAASAPSTAKVTVRSATGATHSFAESETVAFSEYINEALGQDAGLAHLLPLQVESMDLFDALKDGVILCKLINSAQADTIDMRCVHTGALKPLSVYEVVENLNMAINAAVAIGCRVVNIGHDDVMSGSPHLVLGLLWQIVKAGIMAKINLKASPELIQLLPELDDKEALRALLALPPEKVLLKWLNYQVQRVAPGSKEVTNFGPALKDSTVYAQLLTAVAPPDQLSVVDGLINSVARTPDPLSKAQLVIDAATSLGVTQFKVFAADITKGNEKLNMGFMAAIFNHLPGLAAPTDHGTFGASLAHPSAVIKESGHAVRLTQDGCALLGPPMAKSSGTHWVELRILEATGGCYLGVVPPTSSFRTSAPGILAGSIGLSKTGELYSGGEVAQPDCSGGFAMGDLVRIEYDSDKAVLSFTTNGVLHANVPGGMHFGVGIHGGGALEVRIENSSFTGQGVQVALPVEDESDSREERAFRIWINSLGLDTYVSDLPSQVRDGLLLLQLMDAIKPGVVDWTKVTKKPKNLHAKVINCNYAVSLGKSAFGFSLVGIQGKDIQDGITKLVLALTWQLMRYHVIKFLSSLSQKQLTEKDVVDWANTKVGAAMPPVGKLSDSSLSSGIFVLHLLKAIAPRCVDMSQVTAGATAEEKKLNARLAVSCARKAGCMVFLLWEDIVECKQKMLLVLFASLMQLEIADKTSKRRSSQEM